MARPPLPEHVLWLVATECHGPRLLVRMGGKARQLHGLAVDGFPVLPGLVLLPELARGCLQPGERWPQRIPPPLLAALRSALAPWSAAGPLAVRSSAAEEDGGERSYAGQYLTLLDVDAAGLEAAILAVWRSGGSESLAAYRGPEAPGSGAATAGGPWPAVLIQPMLRPRRAGVAFAADPVSGRRGVTLIAAVAGGSADLLAGMVPGDHYELDRHGWLCSSQLLSSGQPLLSVEECGRIAGLVRRLSHRLAAPQDVEWALMPAQAPGAPAELWLLQSRPITTLAELADPDGAYALWDNSNIVESYSGVTTPLTFSFARKAYTEVYTQFCRFMGVPAAVIRQNRPVFQAMIGFLDGRIYYNLLNWYRVLSLLPGYRLNARFLERMLGVKQGLPAVEIERLRQQQLALAASEPAWRWREAARLLGTAAGLPLNLVSLRRRRAAFRRRLERVLLDPAGMAALAEARPDELVACYRRIEADLLHHWDAPLINDFFAMIAYGALRGLLRRWGGAEGAALLHSWIALSGGVISAEPPRLLRRMAMLLAARPELIALLQHGSRAEAERAVACLPPLRRQLDDYLETFGDRCLEELKLETLTLRDDPLPLLRTLGNLAAAANPAAVGELSADPGAPGDGAPGRRRLPAPQLPGRRLSLPQRWLLGWLRQWVCDLITHRENLRFERTRVFGQARRIFLELGHRFTALGWLARPDDIVFLEVEEILGLVEGTAGCADLAGLVAVRRREWERHGAAPPLPRRLETRGLPALAISQLRRQLGRQRHPAVAVPALEQWQGIGCAPGLVCARVSLVLQPRDWLEGRSRQAPGLPILVAGSTDPGWVLLFPHAAGLLVERGSALSHVAIVARELGLPMISDLSDISTGLREGDWVEMDGRLGTVRRLAAAPAAGAGG